jgi:uncharacterized protein involved in exopolysaccharide biosynthesis
MTNNTISSNDEIDIRELIHTLFRYKWIILGITLVAAVIVFIFSKFTQPRIYTAQAQVIITKPSYTTNLETRIQTVPQTPEASILKDLALAGDLLWDVYTYDKVTEVLDEGLGFTQFMAGMSTKLVGTSKIILSVSTEKAETSATIVNAWANKFTERINSLYSINEAVKNTLVEETQKALIKWGKAETALMELMKLPNAIADTQKILLDNKQKALATYLSTLTQLDILISNVQSLQRRLTDRPDDSQLGLEYQLSLISLYQQAAGGLGGIQVQVTQPMAEGVRTVAEAKASLDALAASLDTQKVELNKTLEQLKQDIKDATLAYEAANYQFSQLTTERDLALNAYQALFAQSEETQIDLARDNQTAKIASLALPPQQPLSNRTLMKTALAGVLAFALACFGVLLINWWKTPSPANKTSS